MGARGQLLYPRQGRYRDASRRVHAQMEGHQSSAGEHARVQLLQGQIEAGYRETIASQPCSGLREGKRLAPKLVRVDQNHFEVRHRLSWLGTQCR